MAENKPARRTLSLPITDQGTLNWEGIRGSTAQKLLELLQRDDKLASEFDEARGLTRGEDNEPDLFGGVTQENIHSMLDWLSKANASLLQLVAAKFMPHPLGLKDESGKQLKLFVEPDVLDVMQFNEKQHAELDPRALRIAKKYEHKMPSWLRQHFDLYMFGSMFLAYTAENAKAVIGVQVQRDLGRIQANFAKKKAEDLRRNPPSDSDSIPPQAPPNGADMHPPDEFIAYPPPSSGGEAPIV